MVTTLDMPRLSGGRRRADAMIARLDESHHDLRGATIELDCRELVAGTESFALELVQQLVVERHATLLVINVDDTFATIVDDAVRALGVSDDVTVVRTRRR